MHGPRRADLERSNQAAQEQSAQPEGTPPHLAGKRAKACPLAISLAADWFERTSRPSSYTPKSGRSRGADTRLSSPAPAHIIHEEGVIASPKRGGGFAAVRSTRSFVRFSGEHGAASPSWSPRWAASGGPSDVVLSHLPTLLRSHSSLSAFAVAHRQSERAFQARPRPWLRYGSISAVSFPLSVFRPLSTTAPGNARPHQHPGWRTPYRRS